MSGLLVLALLFGVFWFVLIRPQRARSREQQELITSLEPGDEIVTTGGLYGVITQVDGEVLHMEIADGLVVRTARNAVAGIVEFDEDEDEGEEEDAGAAPPADANIAEGETAAGADDGEVSPEPRRTPE